MLRARRPASELPLASTLAASAAAPSYLNIPKGQHVLAFHFFCFQSAREAGHLACSGLGFPVRGASGILAGLVSFPKKS